MIQVNLLDARTRRAAAPAPPRRPRAHWGTLAMVAAIAGLGLHYAWLVTEASRLDRALAEEQREGARLGAVAQQYQQLQATASALRQRIALIGQLSAAPLNPAPLLAAVDRGVNAGPNLWLTQVGGNGSQVSVAGSAASLGRVADFLTSLRDSGWFGAVELRDSTEPDGGGVDGPYQFNLSAQLAPATPSARQEP